MNSSKSLSYKDIFLYLSFYWINIFICVGRGISNYFYWLKYKTAESLLVSLV